jgi:hypothetical protein
LKTLAPRPQRRRGNNFLDWGALFGWSGLMRFARRGFSADQAQTEALWM